ncbi:Reverse transcriptase domain [Arabidopsis suecica]|uniref:Reverse transcriptase domain n=1 Tax=Arabidopsis suecica TaxID=45249 RepID=A0A8T2AE58_ARASU|nr:Reverse transcriptase domain [Arabidopsis suecica]
MADQDLWVALQHLNLGLERSPLKLSTEAKKTRDTAHQLSLIVKGLHPSQNPAGIKVMMPKIWKLEGRITSRINEDGSVQFFFKQEHQLLTVLDNGPWTYKDWLVVVDRWTRRNHPDYLRIIRFWVRILNLPDDSKDDRIINEIGGILGHVDEIHIQQPTADQAGEIWVRVPIDISGKLTFARYFHVDDSQEPILIRYIYDKLRRFCSSCGSLTHLATACPEHNVEADRLQLPAPDPTLADNLDMAHHQENRPRTPTEGADDTMGETVGSNLHMDVSETQQQSGSQASVPTQERGTKRKVEDLASEDEVSTTRRKIHEDINRIHKIDIMFLIETKNKDSYVQQLGNQLHFNHQVLVSPDGLSGGLAIFWKDTVKCDFLSHPTLNDTDIYVSEGPVMFCLTYVYGNPERQPRQLMWNMMETLAKAGLYQSKPRIVLGDFNEIKHNGEKQGGPLRPEWQFANFRRMLRVSGLHEIKTYGGEYTWIGNRSSGTIRSRLDRVVASAEWKDKFLRAFVQLLDRIGSDHRPLLLHTDTTKWRGIKLFRYDNRWRFNKDVQLAVQNTCNQSEQLQVLLNHLQPKVTPLMNQQLTKPVTEEEIFQALSKMNVDKAPGPDGLNAAERLKPWLQYLISEYQSAFIPGRLITDNVVITHELLHSLRIKRIKTTYMALKLDIAKAFDKVEWTYIEAILRRFGFADQWCQWVMKCLTSVSYSVLINGSPSKKIIPSRGLRQGDPLSPYLYLLCTEGLSSLLTHAMHIKKIHGFRASKNGPPISHMFFADDSLLFCQANEEECQQLLHLLKIYADASGQHVNFQKSAVLFGKNVSSGTQQQIKDITGISKVGGLGKYLGLPEAVGRNKCDTFAYIAQRVQHKLENWYSNLLSPAGKEVLIKSVATALPTYTMSCFLLPKCLLSKITGQIRKFWWSTSKDKHKVPWIAWNKLTTLKQYGGMGFKDLSQFNIALLAKQSWRMLQEPTSLLHRVLKAKYFPKSNLLEASLKSRPSHAWRSIFQGMQLLKQGFKWRVGDGNTIKVCSDPWLDNPPRPARVLSPHQSKTLTVSQLMNPSTPTWDEQKLQALIHPEDVQIIKRIHPRLTKAPDAPMWIYTKDVSENLTRRHIRVSQDFILCVEEAESIIHLFFHCRVAREIWELSPLHIHQDKLQNQNSILHIVQDMLSFKGKPPYNDHLFPFIGWRIWKSRNDLLFNNKRWLIPDIINQAISDFSLWQEANSLNTEQPLRLMAMKDKELTISSSTTHSNSSFFCYVDASWVDPNKKAGIGWILRDKYGKYLIKGSSSIEPTNTVIEAEAQALLEAVLQIKRLNYHQVTFCGDSTSLYRCLEEAGKQCHSPHSHMEIQSYLEDIMMLATMDFRFKFVGRNENSLADALAKQARIKESTYVISWIS